MVFNVPFNNISAISWRSVLLVEETRVPDVQVVYYNCVKFHKNSISSLVGVALTRYMPPLFVKYKLNYLPF